MKMMSSLQLWLPLLLIISLTFESPVAGQQHSMDMSAHSNWEPTPKPLIPGLPKRVRCLLPFFPPCFNLWHSCPVDCSNNCFMDCVSCKPVCSKLFLITDMFINFTKRLINKLSSNPIDYTYILTLSVYHYFVHIN